MTMNNMQRAIVTAAALSLSGMKFHDAARAAAKAHQHAHFEGLLVLRRLELMDLDIDALCERAARAGFDTARSPDIDLLARREIVDELARVSKCG